MITIAGLAACGNDDDAKVDAPPSNELTCANYCTQLTANCTAGLSQFMQTSQCMATCAHYPAGAITDMSGNTLGCRIYHAGAAMDDPAVHCRHAGPGGDGACGANCLGFCTLVLGACTGGNTQYNGDMNACMTTCGGYAMQPLYDSSKTGGDTFACRLYHATAASADPGTHCRHTAATSDTCN